VEEKGINHRKLRYVVAIIGFVLIPLELSFALYEIALYQSLICSMYLLLNILLELSMWTGTNWTRKYRGGTIYIAGRLVFGVVLVTFWSLFNWLIGLIVPWFSYVIIWSLSLAVILLLVLSIFIRGFVVRKRGSKTAIRTSKKPYAAITRGKRFRRASLREVLFFSPLVILAGFLLAYLGWFTSIFHTELGLLQAQVTAFGMTLIFMGVTLPIVRILQERSRRLKRARKAAQERKLETESI